MAFICLFGGLLGFLRSASAQTAPATTPANCLRAVYTLDYKLDSALAEPKRVYMILRTSNGISRFQSLGKHLIDSVYESLGSLPEKERFQKAVYAAGRKTSWDFRYTIFKEPAQDFVAYHDGLNSQDHQYQEKGPLCAWRITEEKKTIGGHQCQQAYARFGGRMWEAWFARDIPVSDGPYKFYGLPGLILQVRDTHDHYVFSLLCLDTNPEPYDVTRYEASPVAAKSTAPILPKKKFLKAKYVDDVTFMDRMAAIGNKFPEILVQNHMQMIQRRNNPLERN